MQHVYTDTQLYKFMQTNEREKRDTRSIVRFEAMFFLGKQNIGLAVSICFHTYAGCLYQLFVHLCVSQLPAMSIKAFMSALLLHLSIAGD